MPHTYVEGEVKTRQWIVRQIEQHHVDIQRLWRRIQQLEDALRASGVSVPPPE